MSKKTLPRVVLILVALILLIFVSFYISFNSVKDKKYTGKMQTIRLGIASESLASLVYIAQKNDYFTEYGVNVNLKNYKGGKQALNGVILNEVDIATSADVPIVFNSFANQLFKIIATIGSSNNEPRIIVRKDSGIPSPEDLAGKHIMTKKGSAVHYFLDVFLTHYELNISDMKLSFTNDGKQMVNALVNRKIDGFSHRQPYIGLAEEQLGDAALVFEKPEIYIKTFNLVATDSVIKNKPEAIERLLKALIRAEKFTLNHPQKSMQYIAEFIGTPISEIQPVWKDIRLSVSLSQSLIITLEFEAKWAIKNKLVDSTVEPNYLNFIDSEILESVKKSVVTIY